ncbi:ABC transporter transmembrane domain-containing protein [Paracoccus sp. MBLB3053]|uniref:ABC transporter transmembrane domain-containing protein n=1 Tax=Paracoccus aurantius TaxID=3073814 RepID=A0ABU2HZW9_9RHOB|nr:ABC transporter transmembrane domain-containing protein [Paracoccus sp. MBLB3053]MDS9470085.1 ABC transporter transmembrane domain-containing protein [Paracoccus sp. MBLB3053]
MEPNIFRYIWMHTKREQILIVCIVLVSMIPYYLALDLPKQIVNRPIQGMGFDGAGSTQPFLDLALNLPFIGEVRFFDGIELERVPLLFALSLTFLGLVIINGLFKFFVNVRKGLLGERLLRRTRYELVDRILRFPPQRFRQAKSGEMASLVKDEIEPLGGFAADAFTQPAMLGGQALTAMAFIFVQHFWLGVLAAAMAGVQVAIIPRMRRRLIVLGRERQLTARELAGRVAEIVDGIQTIHSNDATNWERADIVSRLGRIFRIRYDIYQWKFLVKFLNNFIAQLTPFLFYSIGGYLTIQGKLDVGQLIAVINAYKELPGPLKELIDWDLARQDMQVKYEQVIEQFEAEGLVDPARHDIDAQIPPDSIGPLAMHRLSVRNDLGTTLLDDISLQVDRGETLAVIGESSGGAPLVGDVMAGLIAPSQGRILLGQHDLAQLPERVTGRAIGYTGPAIHLLGGTVMENVTYALKRRPGAAHAEELPQGHFDREWRLKEARLAGNPIFEKDSDWIDYDAIQPAVTDNDIMGSIYEVLEVVGLHGDIMTFAVHQTVTPEFAAMIAPDILEMRRKLRERLAERDLVSAILPFEPDRYNSEATIGENLLFGIPTERQASIVAIVRHPFFREALISTGLLPRLFDLGRSFAQVTLDLFGGMADNPDLLQWLTYMTPEELPEFEQIVARTATGGMERASNSDRVRLVRLSMSYIEPKYRFGLLDDELRDLLVAGRKTLDDDMPADLRDNLQPYDPTVYMERATIMDNILFGKVNRRMGRSEDRIAECVKSVLRDAMTGNRELRDRIMGLGLAYDIGAGGRRLNLLQRQRLALARTLLRKSDYYVFNEPLSGVDPVFQERMIGDILAFLAHQPEPAGVVWVLANPVLAHHFVRKAEFSRGRLVQADDSGKRDVNKNLGDFQVAST